MKNHIPVNSCETGKKCSSCPPCMKKMMLLIPLVLLGGYYAFTYSPTPQSNTCTAPAQGNTCEPSQALSENPQATYEGKNKFANTQSNAQYQGYSESAYNNLLGKKPFALFFHASWCPTCRAEEKLIQENLSSFPKGFTILKADYDKETALKKKYGITMQSIVVVFDKTGKEIGRVGDFSSIEKLTNLLSQ